MRLKLIVASVFLLIGAYSVFWFQLAGQVKETALNWIETSESRLDGIKVFAGDIEVSGYPYKIIVKASTLNAILPSGMFGSQAASVLVPEVAVVFQPWKPNHAIIVTDYFDVVLGELAEPEANFTFDKVKASVILDPDSRELNNLSLIADKMSWNLSGALESVEDSKLEMAEFHLRRSVGAAQEQIGFDLPINRAVYFKAENATIKELSSTILGEKAENIKFEAFLHANEQPDFSIAGLSAWRDDGGTLTIRTFEYETAETGIKLSGDVTLDENFKPLGAFDTKISGFENIIRAYSQNENLPQTTRMLLRSMSQDSNMPSEMELPISMQNGQLYLGPIMLMELEPVIN